MERFTRHTPENFGYAEYGLEKGFDEQDAISRLGAYEDTGLTPSEIMDGKLLTGWISVDEKLPEDERTVLISWGIDGHKAVQTGAYYHASGAWSMFGHAVNVTHWMHLPQPPKED